MFMAVRGGVCLAILAVAAATAVAGAEALSRSSFPPGFIFGVAGSAYQYEGAWNRSGKKPSIWDTFTHTHPEMIANHSNGDVAVDSYDHYKDDVSILKDMNMDAYRFSIAWTRILPNGSISGGIDREGIRYYNDFIDEIVSKGLKPFVTLFHWDSPQALEDMYTGWLSPRIVDDFRDYAEVCFREFGDRVKHWITLNEPWSFAYTGYDYGVYAPGRCSDLPDLEIKCSAGDSGTEPYIVGHHQLLAHAAAVQLYRDKYQESQQGVIGISLVSPWFLPYANSQADKDAKRRALDFMFGWYMDPLVYGDYPESMRVLVGSRLPKFTEAQIEIVKKSFDFIGINYYSSYFVFNVPHPPTSAANAAYHSDSQTNTTGIRRGKLIGSRTASKFFYVYPPGLKHLLVYTKEKYGNLVIYITENGMSEANNASLPLEKALEDYARISFYRQHLRYLREAIEAGVDVRGYFAWSLLDNFEWTSGYTERYGINFVDYNDIGLKRYPKKSHFWFQKLLIK